MTACRYCGHDEHGPSCLDVSPLHVGEGCPCTSDHNAGPEPPERRTKLPSLSCAAPQLLPLSCRRCSVKNTVKEPEALQHYTITIGGASGDALLCWDHARMANELCGITVVKARP